MAARIDKINILEGFFNNFQLRVLTPGDDEGRTASTAIDSYAFQPNQSIASLAGKYADAPFMENFSEFLERYKQEINELNEE